jgi:hypothetical protein
MTKKRLCLIAGSLVIFAVAGLTISLMMTDNGPGVTKANFDRIKQGMTEEDVARILGRPADLSTPVSSRLPQTIRRAYWQGDGEKKVSVTFYDEAAMGRTWDAPETFLETIQRWLHLPP